MSALLSTQRKAISSPTPFRLPWGLDRTAATSAGAITWSMPHPSRAHTRSGRWQMSPTVRPRQSMPARASTAAAWGGITGSWSAGAFRGRTRAPSASESTISAAAAQAATSPPVILSFRSRAPTVMIPCCSSSARRAAGSFSSVINRPGWGRMWVVVVTMTVFPASRASRARAYMVVVLPPPPTRAMTRRRSMSSPSLSQSLICLFFSFLSGGPARRTCCILHSIAQIRRICHSDPLRGMEKIDKIEC